MLSFTKRLQEINSNIQSPEETLSKGLNMPFNGTNSSSRKIMFATQLEHAISLFEPEVPIISTGYENEFGRYSSSLKIANKQYEVIAKISKFGNKPNDNYYLVLRSPDNEYEVIQRILYHHNTETYGYLLNNENLDKLSIGSIVNAGNTLQKSTAYDKYNNRMDGVNLISTYLNSSKTTEDGIVLSESAQTKLTSPLLKKVIIMVNDNDIPLNLYGNEREYKVLPDIGESIKGNLLMALRREKKEESLFTQAYNRLFEPIISDEKFTVMGEIIDMDIYCNNPELLNNYIYNAQLNSYYGYSIQFSNNIVNTLSAIVNNPNNKCSYDLLQLYHLHNRIIQGKQFIREGKIFSNIVIEVMVMERNTISVGDKLSDRYGGKGVVSKIVSDDMMPRLDNGKIVDIIFNSATCVNRLNAGQLFETSLTFISSRLIDIFQTGIYDIETQVELYLKFISFVSQKQYQYLKALIEPMDIDSKAWYMDSVIRDGIMLSIEPMSEPISIDTLEAIYKEFPFINQYNFTIPQLDSNNNIRYIEARRPIVIGKKYIYRMKQYAEEKSSATSLSSTNIKNENAKSRSNKNYKSLYAKTPIMFGNMETANMFHLNIESVISNLMIHSASPFARRLTEDLLTGDPFDIDIKLDTESKNRNVEILFLYLKAMGIRLVFERREKKKINPISFTPVEFVKIPKLSPITRYVNEKFNPIEILDSKKKFNPVSIVPVITDIYPN